MANTEISSSRAGSIVEGVVRYKITTTCTVKGELPDTGIFLLTITQPTDPKNDQLARVIDIADTSTYKTNRNAAITAGDTLWRSASVTLIFDDIVTANLAQKEFVSRINKLVEKFNINLTEFETAGEVISFPTIDQSLKTERTKAYVDSRDDVLAKEKLRDDKAEELATAQAELIVIEERLTEAQADLSKYLAIQGPLVAVYNAYASIKNSIQSKVSTIRVTNQGSGGDASSILSIETDLVSIEAQLSAMDLQTSALSNIITFDANSIANIVSSLQSRAATLASERLVILTKINQLSRELAVLEGAVDAARAVRDAALTALLAICPDIDLNSI